MSSSTGPVVNITNCTMLVDPNNGRSYTGSGAVFSNLLKNTHKPNILNSPTYTKKSFSFSGSNQHINLGTIPNFAVNTTMIAWAKASAYVTEQPLFCYGTGVATSGRQLTIHTTGKANFNGFNSDLLGTTVLTKNVWYQIVGTYDGTTAKIYVNGVLENTGAKSWSMSYNAAYIGRDLDLITPKYATSTEIGQVMYYNTVLDATQIMKLFKAQRAKYSV